MAELKVGIVGAGGISRGHGQRLKAIPGVRLVALAEPSAASVAAFNRAVFPGEAGPEVYADHRELLAKERPDAVLVASPHTLHCRQILDALEVGAHVLAEKPLACSTEETDLIIEKSRSSGRKVVVSYQRRFQGIYKFMRRFLHSPEFGRVFYVASFLSQGWLKAQTGTWRQDPALSGGGQLNDSGSHIVDMLFWMLDDDVESVSAFIDNRDRKVDIDSAVSFRTRRGTLGTLSVVGSGPTQVFWEDMTVSGEEGRALFLRQGALRATLGHGLESVLFEKFPDGESPDEHFVRVVSGQAENASPPEDFLRTIGFTEAAWRSAAEGGRPVSLAPAKPPAKKAARRAG